MKSLTQKINKSQAAILLIGEIQPTAEKEHVSLSINVFPINYIYLIFFFNKLKGRVKFASKDPIEKVIFLLLLFEVEHFITFCLFVFFVFKAAGLLKITEASLLNALQTRELDAG